MSGFLGGKGNPDGKGGDKKKFNWSLVYLVLTLALVGIYFFSANEAIREVNDM